MKIPYLALSVLLASAGTEGFAPSLSPVLRHPVSLRVSTSLPDATSAPAPPIEDFDSATVPSFPELGRDGIYHIENKEQHKAFLEANQDKLVIMKVYAPWCKACKAMAPKFQTAASDPKYKKFPIVFAELPIVNNKEYVKQLGVVALPSVQFYAGGDGLVDTFPCGPSKMALFKRKVVQLVRERIDPQTLGLKETEVAADDDEESQPCADRSILEETADQETELVVGGVKVSQEEMNFLRKDVPFFADFTDDEFSGLMKKARLLSFEPGNVIMKQGKRGKTFYVIQTGEVGVYVHTGFEDPLTTPPNYLGTMVNQLEKSDYFGERALMTGEPRAASIRAEEKTRCFAFDVSDIPASSVLSGRVGPSEARIEQVNNKYGVDVQDLDLAELSRQLEAAKLGSQIRGSVNNPKKIEGVDFEQNEADVPREIAVPSTPTQLGLVNDAIIPLLLRFRLVRYATKCFEYIMEMRPRWGDPGILRRRTSLLSMLPESQKEEFKEVFKLIDISGDRLIHLFELRQFMESVGEQKTDEELQAMIQKCGNSALNGEEVISYDDFMGIMAEAEFYNLFKDTFKSIDIERTGFVKASDLERVLGGMQDLISDERTSLIDVEEKDMMIDYEQFSQMLLGTTGL